MTKKSKAKQIDGEWLQTANSRLANAGGTKEQIAKFEQMNKVIQQAETIFIPLKDLESNLQLQGKNTYYTRVGAYYGGPGEEVEVTEITSQRHLDAAAVINLLNTQLTQAIENYKKGIENVTKNHLKADMIAAKTLFVSEIKYAFNKALKNEQLTTHRDLFSRVFEGFKALCNQYLGTKFELKITESEKYVRNRYALMNEAINKTTTSLQNNEEKSGSSLEKGNDPDGPRSSPP